MTPKTMPRMVPAMTETAVTASVMAAPCARKPRSAKVREVSNMAYPSQ